MKNLVIAILCFALAPLSALAAAVDAAGDVTLILPSDGSQYTLQKNASFESLTVNNATFVFSIAAGGSVELLSSDKKKLDNDLDPKATITCETNQSRVFLSVPSGGSTQTVTVTPSGSCSSSSSQGGGSPSLGGGGGGGGGGSTGTGAASVPTPAPSTVQKVAELKGAVAELQQKIAQKIAGERPAVSALFSKDLGRGQRNNDILRLQALLASDKEVYPEGIVSGYYGPKTEAAVRRFQLKYGVITNPGDLGNGRVGPKTRAKLAEVFGKAPAPAPSPIPPPVAPAPVPPPAPSPASEAERQSLINTVRSKIEELTVKLLKLQVQLIQEKINALKGKQ